jgi:ribonuclease P protein component
MLAKKFRLHEREVKKVLHKGKPFFSYSIVFNVFPNTLWHSRFAIVIGWKSVPNAVIRNKYRRAYYDIAYKYTQKNLWDVVCVVKKQTKLDAAEQSLKKIESEINYLFEKKLWKNT